MSLTHAQSLVPLILFALSIASSCSVGPTRSGASAPGTPAKVAPVSTGSRRSPPPVVKTPMPGAPGESALAEARLVSHACEEIGDADTVIKKMRAEVDASFKEWVADQPGCWEEYRKEDLCQRGLGPCSDAYGAGSLGLSGIGEGGGGYGEGAGSGPALARVFSGTNNQVAAVDEADIVKTDGRYVYLVANGALRIVEALKPRLVSVTKLPGSVRDLYVKDDRAVVFSSSSPQHSHCRYAYDCRFAGDGSSTKITVFDLRDRSSPKKVRQIELSGSLMASRRIGNAVHTVVADRDSEVPLYETWPQDLQGPCGTAEAIVREKFAKLKRDNEQSIREKVSPPKIKDLGSQTTLCGHFYRTRFGNGVSFTSVVSFDLTRDDRQAKTVTLQSRPGAIYASADALYLSVTNDRRFAREWYSFERSTEEVSEIHKFRIGTDPEELRYVGSGVVPGHVLNQFSMDEWYGNLRVATSVGQVPDPAVRNVVSTLVQGDSGNLVRVGALEHLAPGEDIRAVRFDGDRGYVVTFKKTDPLFVLDLYHPARPSILGQLKIPGFSTYLHRIDPEHLLSIGFDANDHGDFAFFDGLLLQLFDVSKPTEPKLLHREKIGTRGSTSEAATDHLAFNYLAETKRLAIPATLCEGGKDGVAGNKVAFSGLLVYDVDLGKGFTKLGGINHLGTGVTCGLWWSDARTAVKRSVFLDDLVYSIASDRVKVQRLGHLGQDLADIRL